MFNTTGKLTHVSRRPPVSRSSFTPLPDQEHSKNVWDCHIVSPLARSVGWLLPLEAVVPCVMENAVGVYVRPPPGIPVYPGKHSMFDTFKDPLGTLSKGKLLSSLVMYSDSGRHLHFVP